MITLTDRLEGAVWGHLVGDALGVPYEFGPPRPAESIRWGHAGTYGQPPGTWSDDGGLMLALLDSLLSSGFDLEDQARRALAWRDGPDYKPGGRFDIGGTTHSALSRFKAGAAAEAAGGDRESDNGNGSLMRILPLALVRRSTSDAELVSEAMRASSVTHAHPRSQLTCALYSLALRRLLNGDEPAQSISVASTALAQLVEPIQKHELGLVLHYSTRSGSGYVVDTFWSAWDAFSGAGDYAAAVTRAVAYGNDTDTTACVTGGLAGAYWGIEALPAEWRASMRGADIVDPLVARLTAGMV